MHVIFEIQRFNSELDSTPKFQRYELEVEATDRVIDVLLEISQNQDSTLAFRKSCAHGVCGSDAMRINGVEKLACKTLVRDVAEGDQPVIRVEPLQHLEVKKDLINDFTAFQEKFKKVRPYLMPKEAAPTHKEYHQSPEERQKFDEATKCINCGACYSACPILDKNPNFLGPAALVQASRFVNDSRDQGLAARMNVLDNPDGVWGCEQKFNCTRVCPREIKITKLINEMKRKIDKHHTTQGTKANKE